MTSPAAELVFDPLSVDLEGLLRRLHLANTRRVWKELVATADAETWSARQLLATLLVEEVAHRQQTRLSREVRNAGFPFLKTIDDLTSHSRRPSSAGSFRATSPRSWSARVATPSCSAAPAAARRTSRSPSPTAPSRTDTRPASSRRLT